MAPKRQFVINAFDNQGGRAQQDIGLDGLLNKTNEVGAVTEETYFKEYLTQISAKVNDQNAIAAIKNDPAGDDFVHYLSEKFNKTGSIIERYKNFMGLENNSLRPIIRLILR